MPEIYLQNTAGDLGFEEELVKKAARATLQRQNAPENSELTVVFTDDEEIKRLNAQFLGIDAPTDVLSFPSGEEDPETHCPYLGDIILSLPKAAAQASQGGHSLQEEVQLLVVHGVLHLLGYDHAEENEKASMWQVQAEILSAIGCPLSPP